MRFHKGTQIFLFSLLGHLHSSGLNLRAPLYSRLYLAQFYAETMKLYLAVFAAATNDMTIRQLVGYVAAGIQNRVDSTLLCKGVRNKFLLIQFFPIKIAFCQLNASDEQLTFFALWHLMILFVQYITCCSRQGQADIIDGVLFSQDVGSDKNCCLCGAVCIDDSTCFLPFSYQRFRAWFSSKYQIFQIRKRAIRN